MKNILLLWDLAFLQLIGLVGSFEYQHGTTIMIFLLLKTVTSQLFASVNGSVPLPYAKAILSADAEKWQAAMQKEFNSLLENKTRDCVALPSVKN